MGINTQAKQTPTLANVRPYAILFMLSSYRN
jgi:hypothetical protein